MTTLLHGELIKAITTRTMAAFAAIAFVVSVIFVLEATLSGDLVSLADKETAIAGGPFFVLLFGIVGMRERVALLGGQLETGALASGGFRVAARLPIGEPS